jgi:Flp pilus assembly protein TadG
MRTERNIDSALRRRGMALMWGVICLPVLLGISSLAIDMGRMQAIKTEVQRAVDAAARYGAKGLTDGTAVSKAITAAADNTIDAYDKHALTITAANIQTGHWDSTTRVFTSGATPTDAIRINVSRSVRLLFGPALGLSQSTINVTSIACLSGPPTPTLIGLDFISGKNNVCVGYNSSLGAPGGANVSSSFVMGSNGSIDFGNNQSISGSVILGPSGSYTGSSPAPVVQSTALSYPATESPPIITSGNLNVSGTVHVSGGGTKCYTNITFANNATLIFDSPTTVYVTGNITSGQGPTIKPASNVPSDLRIRMSGGPAATAFSSTTDNVTITALVYAPAVTFAAKNNCTLYGSMLFRSIDVKNNMNAYYDTASGSVVAGLGVTGNGVQMVK